MHEWHFLATTWFIINSFAAAGSSGLRHPRPSGCGSQELPGDRILTLVPTPALGPGSCVLGIGSLVLTPDGGRASLPCPGAELVYHDLIAGSFFQKVTGASEAHFKSQVQRALISDKCDCEQ